ncbi:MAG: hypothetical protein IT306_10815 [Chloroflexi bacterium]|nr:hypothetical protein [Chloroflexota bacterium]
MLRALIALIALIALTLSWLSRLLDWIPTLLTRTPGLPPLAARIGMLRCCSNQPLRRLARRVALGGSGLARRRASQPPRAQHWLMESPPRSSRRA